MEQKDELKPVEKPAEKVDEKAETKTSEQPQKEEKQPAKKGEGWIKFLRILIWCAVAILLTVGLQLRALSKTSSAYADGSQTAKASLGNTLFWIGLILGLANLAWGAYRWFSRLVKEKWKAGKIIGKLIGGGIWRTLAIMPVIAIAYFVISPAIIAKTVPKPAELVKYGSVLHNTSPNEAENLSEAEKRQLAELLLLPNVKFSTDASSNVSTKKSLFSANVYAGSKVTVLNKAKLSPQNHFVIFYTDTGDDKVSDDGVANMGAMLEEIIASYKSQYDQGLNYKKSSYEGTENEDDMQAVLVASGIDKNITNTAMPVYIVNPFSENPDGTLASYVGTEWNDFKHQFASFFKFLADKDQEEGINLYESSPSLPFIHVQPDAVGDKSTYEIVAHELGHHFISNYCFTTKSTSCPINKMLNEAMANYLSVSITPAGKQGTVIHGHYNTFVGYGCYSADKLIIEPIRRYGCHSKGSSDGYPAVSYMYNYANVVPNGKKILFDAFNESDPMEYLYNQAGRSNYKRVITTWAERTLLNNYGMPALTGDKDPSGFKVPCYDFCTEDQKVFYSSIRFMYITKADFYHKTVKITSESEDITFMSFGKNGNTWEKIESTDGEISYTFMNNSKYETVVLVPVNYSYEDDRMITISVSDSEIEEIIEEPEPVEEEPEEDPYNPITLDDNGCARIEIKSLLELPGRLYRMLNESEFAEGAFTDELAKIEADTNKAKEEIDFEILTICEDKIKAGVNFDQASNIIKQSTHTIHLGLRKSEEINLSAFVKYEPLTRRSKGYILMETPDIGMHLYSITVE